MSFATALSRMRRDLCVCVLAALAFILAPSLAAAFPWDIDMYRGAAVQPLSRAPRVMPEDTMPVDRGEPPMSPDEAAQVQNPLAPTSHNLARGRDLFLTDCAPCHGDSGKGDGPVVHLLKQHPKDLTSDEVKSLSDGSISGIIRNGFQMMPSYADAMAPSERWQVVLYVRSLQGAASSRVEK